MLDKIKDALTQRNISGWQIRETRKTSFQSFLAKEEREALRTVETTRYTVSLLQKRTPANGAGIDLLGMSTFTVIPGDAQAFEKSLDEAVYAASLVGNQTFELPEQPAALPDVEICDTSLSQETLAKLEDRLLAAVAKEKSTRLSAAEFFVNRMVSRLVNHRGLDVTQEETLLHTEFVLLSKAADRENEYIDRYSRRYLKDFDLEGEVAESASFARDATRAALPKTGRFPVLLSEEPLDHLFNPLIARASARLKYNRMLDNAVGKSVVDDGEIKGDRLNIWSNNLLPRAVGSYRFDGYGTPARRTKLIENNVVKQLIADKRYSDYLGVPLTGEMGNFEVEGGTRTLAELQDASQWGGTVYHLQAFSAFEPNSITGAFSAEIRAGFEISKSGIRPIKGGSVSGVLHKDISDAYLSREVLQREHCRVPAGVLFRALTVTGA